MKTELPEEIKNGTFLIVGSGEIYITEFASGEKLLERMLCLQFGEVRNCPDDEKLYWANILYDFDHWRLDNGLPVMWSEDIGETDRIEIFRLVQN